MSSNVKSNLWLCNLAIPADGGARRRLVVIVSSIGGLRGSTHARRLRHLQGGGLRAVRAASPSSGGRRNVRVNCVAPGLVKTDFARALWEDEERLKRRCATTPLRRIGEPDEIAGAVAFLGLRGRRAS